MCLTCTFVPQNRLHIWDDFITQQEGEENLDQVRAVKYCLPHSVDGTMAVTYPNTG